MSKTEEPILGSIFDIRFPEKDSFSKRFNEVGELYEKFKNAKTMEEQNETFERWWQAKYNLELGIH